MVYIRVEGILWSLFAAKFDWESLPKRTLQLSWWFLTIIQAIENKICEQECLNVLWLLILFLCWIQLQGLVQQIKYLDQHFVFGAVHYELSCFIAWFARTFICSQQICSKQFRKQFKHMSCFPTCSLR